MRTKKVSFYDDSASEERAPLLSPSRDDKAAKAEQAAGAETSSGDAVVELEGLSRLLVRSCKVFTVASCLSVLLGSVRLRPRLLPSVYTPLSFSRQPAVDSTAAAVMKISGDWCDLAGRNRSLSPVSKLPLPMLLPRSPCTIHQFRQASGARRVLGSVSLYCSPSLHANAFWAPTKMVRNFPCTLFCPPDTSRRSFCCLSLTHPSPACDLWPTGRNAGDEQAVQTP